MPAILIKMLLNTKYTQKAGELASIIKIVIIYVKRLKNFILAHLLRHISK